MLHTPDQVQERHTCLSRSCLCWRDDTQMKTDISLKFFCVSQQWSFWIFDDGWVFICKCKAICINLVSFQAFFISKPHIWLYNVPIPGALLYSDSIYARRKYMKECHCNFLVRQSVRSSIPPGGKGLTLLISQASLSRFYDPMTSFPRGTKFEQSITKCNQIHPASPWN